MSSAAFSVPPWDGQARSVAFVCRFTNGKHSATCELWTHPIGAELRVVLISASAFATNPRIRSH